MTDPLRSWNEGAAKQAILAFVNHTTTAGGRKFVEPIARIATFDQDGTLWVEQPTYSQVLFAFHHLGVMAAKDLTPSWWERPRYRSKLFAPRSSHSDGL